jgi:hypothetical protein
MLIAAGHASASNRERASAQPDSHVLATTETRDRRSTVAPPLGQARRKLPIADLALRMLPLSGQITRHSEVIPPAGSQALAHPRAARHPAVGLGVLDELHQQAGGIPEVPGHFPAYLDDRAEADRSARVSSGTNRKRHLPSGRRYGQNRNEETKRVCSHNTRMFQNNGHTVMTKLAESGLRDEASPRTPLAKSWPGTARSAWKPSARPWKPSRKPGPAPQPTQEERPTQPQPIQ